MERLRPLLEVVRLDRALLAPCAVFVGSSFARYDAQPGPGFPAHVVVSVAALLAAVGVELIDLAWDLWGAEADGAIDARDAAIVGSLALVTALLVAAILVPLSGSAAVGYGLVAILLGIVRGMPVVGLDGLGRGLGDAANVAALGPLAVLAGFASQCGHGSLGAAILGVPVGFIAAGVLYLRHFTRADADARHERQTPVAILGEDQARLGLPLFPLLAIVALVLIVAAEEGPRGLLAAGVPLAALAALGWRAARDPSTDLARFGWTASIVAGIAMITLAVALRLAVR
jgi:1,4-dihydroxy-2-naphthoate octaprenyltransferase